jgi:hypothetical protein
MFGCAYSRLEHDLVAYAPFPFGFELNCWERYGRAGGWQRARRLRRRTRRTGWHAQAYYLRRACSPSEKRSAVHASWTLWKATYLKGTKANGRITRVGRRSLVNVASCMLTAACCVAPVRAARCKSASYVARCTLQVSIVRCTLRAACCAPHRACRPVGTQMVSNQPRV